MRLSTLNLRRIGGALAGASVIAPALPMGPLFANPPMPFAALWLAFGLAAEDRGGPRAFLALFALGLLHDQLAGNPYGVFAFIYLLAYPLGWLAARAMSAPNLIALWGGFIAACAGVAVLSFPVLRMAFGEGVPMLPMIQTLAVTALLFPLVRPLYMVDPGASRLTGLGGGR
jgi:cell shape-determining protein MreD